MGDAKKTTWGGGFGPMPGGQIFSSTAPIGTQGGSTNYGGGFGAPPIQLPSAPLAGGSTPTGGQAGGSTAPPPVPAVPAVPGQQTPATVPGAPVPYPISYSPPSLPNTSGTPGSGAYWGPGSTYIPGYGSNPAELITANKNAYLLGPDNQWTPAGVNAQVPTALNAPVPENAAPNSIVGQSISPFLAPNYLRSLQKQLGGQLEGGLTPQEISGTLSSFFGNLPQTVNMGAPSGGYRPGYAVPQSSIEYVPGAAVADLTRRLEAAPVNDASRLQRILGNWSGKLSSFGPAGVNVPTLGTNSSGAQK